MLEGKSLAPLKEPLNRPSKANKRENSRNGARQRPTRIVVADDHKFMRELIIAMLSRQDAAYEVVAGVDDAKGAIAACEELSPDLLILDINLPDESGIDVVPKIQRAAPDTRILLCTAYVTDDRVLDALRSGAHGFIEKTNSWDDFVNAVDRVGRGEQYFCSKQSCLLADAHPAVHKKIGPASTVGLSPREREVLTLIAHGSTSKEMAQKLGISVATVDTHRTNLMSKLHIRNVAGLVVFAFRAGLLRLHPDRS